MLSVSAPPFDRTACGDQYIQIFIAKIYGKESIQVVDMSRAQLTFKKLRLPTGNPANSYQNCDITKFTNGLDNTPDTIRKCIVDTLAEMKKIVSLNLRYHEHLAYKGSLVELHSARNSGADVPKKTLELHPYQNAAFKAGNECPPDGRMRSLQLPTGTGKTYIIMKLAFCAFKKDAPSSFIVLPTLVLLQQTYDVFLRYLPASKLGSRDVLKIATGWAHIPWKNLHSPNKELGKGKIILCCQKSFVCYLRTIKTNTHENSPSFSPSLVILDEVHMLTDLQLKLIEELSPETPVVGLTATPRPDRTQRRIFHLSYQQALTEKHLAPCFYDMLGVNYSPENVENAIPQLSHFLRNCPHPTGQALLELKGAIFVSNTSKARKVCQTLRRDPTINVYEIHSKTQWGENLKAFKQDARGIAVMVRMGAVGLSVPSLSWALIFQKMENTTRFIPNVREDAGF